MVLFSANPMQTKGAHIKSCMLTIRLGICIFDKLCLFKALNVESIETINFLPGFLTVYY